MEINYIEGLPCAGKSLLIKALETQKYHICHELGRVLKKEEFPGNGKTIPEINAIDERFIKKESERYQGFQEGDCIYFDRSFLTHLGYAYAYSRYTQLNALTNTVQLYQQAIEKGLLKCPNQIININIDSNTSIERQNKKIQENPNKALPIFWRDKGFLNDLLFAYDKLYECYNGNVLNIDGNLSTDEKIQDILVNGKNISTKNTSIDLDKYLTKLQ